MFFFVYPTPIRNPHGYAGDNRGMARSGPVLTSAISAVVLLLAACAHVSVETTPPGPPLATIVTWNMNAGVGDLAALLTDLDRGALNSARAADTVVLLQEAVVEHQRHLQALSDARGWSLFLVPVRYDGRRTRSNAILSSRPLLLPRAIPLPQERQPRSAAAAFVHLGSQRMFVVSAQLENRLAGLKGLVSDGARARQAAALVDALPADEPGVVAGDLNTWMGEGEPALRILARRFSDTPVLLPAATFRGGLQLDHLFLDLPDGWRGVARVAARRYGSDHHPVVADIFGD